MPAGWGRDASSCLLRKQFEVGQRDFPEEVAEARFEFIDIVMLFAYLAFFSHDLLDGNRCVFAVLETRHPAEFFPADQLEGDPVAELLDDPNEI